MNLRFCHSRFLCGISLALVFLGANAQSMKISLSGAQEVPPVTTNASGSGTITVAPDGSISGSVTTSGVEATMAHIHEAAPGQQNGPVIIVRLPLLNILLNRLNYATSFRVACHRLSNSMGLT